MVEYLDDSMDFSAYMRETDAKAKVKNASLWIDDMKARLRAKPHERKVYMPWEKTFQNFDFKPGEVTVWGGVNGHGKALCLETQILTKSGFKRMGDIHPGDVVFDETGSPCNVIAETSVMLNRPCYRVTFSDGESLIADEQHEWLTKSQLCLRSERNAKRIAESNHGLPRSKFSFDQSHKRTTTSIVTTKQIAESLIFKSGKGSVVKNHAISVCGKVNFCSENLPIDPYVFGLWLGDGSSAGGQITTADNEIVKSIESSGFEVVKLTAKYLYGVHGLHKPLRLLGLLNSKQIPETYAISSSEQRLALLQGLMDADGSVTEYGRCEFTSINRNLADGVLWLTRSLGIISRLITGRAMLNGKDCGEKYRITFTTSIPVFRLTRKLNKIKKLVSTRSTHRWIVACELVDSVPVKCIQVDSDSHLYLAGKALIPTHNSLVTSQIILSLIGQGEKVCVASFEMKPHKQIERFHRMYCGMNPFSPEFQGNKGLAALDELYDEFGEWVSKSLWIYDQQGTTQATQVLGMARYCARELGIGHVFVDNLAKCVSGEDDYNGQKNFVDSLTAIARDENIHIHLVHHMRKGSKETDPLDKSDFKGSGSIADQVDNLIGVWRNKAKELDMKTKGSTSTKVSEPDTTVRVFKQRNYEGNDDGEPLVFLWFDRDSWQFLGEKGNPLMFFPNFPHRQTL